MKRDILFNDFPFFRIQVLFVTTLIDFWFGRWLDEILILFLIIVWWGALDCWRGNGLTIMRFKLFGDDWNDL
jgi:hypothetical protein